METPAMKNPLTFAVLAAAFSAGLAGAAEKAAPAPEKVSFVTTDGVTIYGTYYPGAGPEAAAVVCLPMMGATRDTYAGLAARLQKLGYAVLAIDMRGHGESVDKAGKAIAYKDFKADDFRDMRLDVEAAFVFLADAKKLEPRSRAVVGASIGATAAVLAAAEDAEIGELVLLSPGLAYRGVSVVDAFKKLKARPVLVVVGTMDEYSMRSAKTLDDLGGESVDMETRASKAHGTGLLAQYKVTDAVVDWLKKIAPPTEASAEK